MAGIIRAWKVSVKTYRRRKIDSFHQGYCIQSSHSREITAVVFKHDNRAIRGFKGCLILYCYTAQVVQQNAHWNASLNCPSGCQAAGRCGDPANLICNLLMAQRNLVFLLPAVSGYLPDEPNISELGYAKYYEKRRGVCVPCLSNCYQAGAR